MEKTMEKIVALCNNRGFIYPGSQIYGGLANTWDYGNLGVELKNNVKKAWWQKFVTETPENVGVDCAILMNPRTWEASGHIGSFSDPLMDCRQCHERFRADKVIEDYAQENGITLTSSVDGWSDEELNKLKSFCEGKGCKLREFTSASGHQLSGYPVVAKGVSIGETIFKEFHYYLIINGRREMSLLGDDFIDNCKYSHEPHDDIEITKFDFDNYCGMSGKSMNSDEVLSFIDNLVG